MPSYANALGASGDRPAALAELMGILVNQGRLLPQARVQGLQFATATLVSSRVVSRSATLAFLIGDHWFGTLIAYVQGDEAEGYHFTSALPSQLLKALLPGLRVVEGRECGRGAQVVAVAPSADTTP